MTQTLPASYRATPSDGDEYCRPLSTSDCPQLDQSQVGIANRLHCRPAFEHRSLRLEWRGGTTGRIRNWFDLRAGEHRLWLGLDGDAPAVCDAPFDWRDFRGAPQRLAWSAGHEDILQLLSVAFRCDWVLFGITSSPPPATDSNQVTTEFDITSENTLLARGRMIVGTPLADRFASHPTHPAGQYLWPAVPVRLRCVVDTIVVTPPELRSLVVGSVVRLNRGALTGPRPPVSLRAGALCLAAEIRGRNVVVAGPTQNEIQPPHEDKPMTQSMDVPVDTLAADTRPDPTLPIDVDSIPVELRFEVGELELPMARLQSLAPGFVFAMRKPVCDQTVRIVANDALVALGELVCIGDQLGVRVAAMCTSPAPALDDRQ